MRAQEGVRPLARQIGSRARDPDADGVQLAVERDSAQLDPAEQRFGVRNRGRAREDACHGAGEREGARDVRTGWTSGRERKTYARSGPGRARKTWRNGERTTRSSASAS